MKRTTWHGIDASNSESLFEYGFLIRWNTKNKMYDLIVAIGYSDNGMPNEFAYSTWDADYFREMLAEEKETLKGVVDMCGLNADTYLEETNDANLLNDLICYMGVEEVGVDYYYCKPHTEKEVRKRLNRVLD